MQPRLEATLADFVPALRFLSPDRVDRHLGHPDLPPAWWTSVPIARAVDAIGATELPDRLADLSYSELRHLRLGDLLPAAWLARNDFRLSQWPDGVRTNILVRTPDWADLLGATVREIGEWTQIGTTTVRPVISQLFAAVLGLLPREAAPSASAEPAAEPGVTESASDTGGSPSADDSPEPGAERPDAAPYAADENAADAEDEASAAPSVPAPRGIRISKRPTASPAGASDDAADAGDAEDDSYADGYGTDLGPVSDLVDAIEDELRPVSMPAPPTGDLGEVVRWLAEEAPDIPLMSELVRVTLETTAVVGVEGAPPEVRTALVRLMSLVPEALRPEGLEVTEDDVTTDRPDIEDPYDTPELTAMPGAVPLDGGGPYASPPRPDHPGHSEHPGDDEGTARPDEAGSSGASRVSGPSAADVAYAGADDLTMLAVPGTPPPPPAWAADADDFTMLAMQSVPRGGDDGEDLPHAAAPDRTADRDGSTAEPPSPVDAFGEIPPVTREDWAVPPSPRAQEPEQGTGSTADNDAGDAHSGGHADDSVDAYGEIPPLTRDDVPIQLPPDRAAREPRVSVSKRTDTGGADAGPSAAEAAEFSSEHAEQAAPDRPRDAGVVAASAASAGSPGIVVPPRPTAPPPVPPRPTTAPPASDTDSSTGPGPKAGVRSESHAAAHDGPRNEPPAGSTDERPDSTPHATPGGATDDAARDTDTGPTPAPGNIVMVLAAWFTGREPRWRALARDRMFTDSPREIASLAAEFDKDSVEVEALERALWRHLASQLEQPGGAAVRAHLGHVEARLGPVATVGELRDLDKRHTTTIPGLGVQLWQVVRGLLSLNTSADGWVTAGAPGELESRTAEIVGAACERGGSVPLTALEPPLSALGVRPEVREAWIARLDGFEVVDGVVSPWAADESGVVPAAPTEKVARPPAAREGHDPHDAARQTPSAHTVDADPGSAARCFRDDQGVWWYRIDVDAALLDGERLVLPTQFVHALGLRPGGSLRLHHAAGPAALRWEHEPYCVSLRTILAGLGAEAEDMVFIGSVRPGRLETRLLAGDGKLRLPRWARALRHTGVDPVPDQVNLPALLGSRLGLDDGCDLKAVLKRLQDRGDADVLELLGVAPTG